MKDLTFVCAFFENRGMLLEQQRVWREYPADLRARFHAIVTDDCSPDGLDALPAFEPVPIASYQLYRTLEKKPWNWLFGRNLGWEKARTEWVLFTDIDHVLPMATLRSVLEADLDPSAVYRFSRVDAPNLQPKMKNGQAHPHPNTWMMTRTMFDRIGGYDERFSGHYGSDSEFRERVQATCSAVIMLGHWPMVRYPREVIPDASTTTFERKSKSDGKAVSRIKADRATIVDECGRPTWKPLRITLPYRLEASCSAS